MLAISHDDPRIPDLLGELLDSGATPEEVCSGCPELLSAVQEQWRHMCLIRQECDALFPSDSDDADLRTGVDASELPSIPGHEVEEAIGRGGMGIVFRARHLGLNRTVAVKMALAGSFASPRERLRFQREAQAVASLQHPNIVQVHDVGDDAGRPYFTMEFLEGGSLARKLAGTPQSATHAAESVRTLAGAVAAAHARGIVHRDLKPANVLLSADGTPKISDFGLARRQDEVHDLTGAGAVLGTPSYMAPEQIQGPASAVGVAADIYALGAILYELLTGRPPFRAPSAAETLQQAISQAPASPRRLNASVPRDLETICLKCLSKEPAKRYRSAEALADDLGRFLRGETIAARPEGLFAKGLRLARRRPVETTSFACTSLLVLLLLGGGSWQISERATASRLAEAKQSAGEAAVRQDLDDMRASLRSSDWSSAAAAAARAQAKLEQGDRDSLRRSLERGQRELAFASNLDGIRARGAETIGGERVLSTSDTEYADAFREMGLGDPGASEEAIAIRIRECDIREAILAALDHWLTSADDPARKEWILKVATKADPNPAGWRLAARTAILHDDQEAIRAQIAAAPVQEGPVSLLLALEQRLRGTHTDHVVFLERIHDAYPDDFWINARIGGVLAQIRRYSEAIGYLRAAVALRKNSAFVRNNLAHCLSYEGRRAEAVAHYRVAAALDPQRGAIRSNFAHSLWAAGRTEEAKGVVQEGIRDCPLDGALRTTYAQILKNEGDVEGALDQYREGARLAPDSIYSQSHFRDFLLSIGKPREALTAWRRAIELSPNDHGAAYGYAELCLFLGNEEAYRDARVQLLAEYGDVTDPRIAERVGRACLLLPGDEDELEQATALAERAASADAATVGAVYAHYLFARALADFRRGNHERAIATLRDEANHVLYPAPKLIEAMARFQSGETVEARDLLAEAALTHDWRPTAVRDQDGWIVHSLRREASQLIVPQWTDLASGKYAPENDAERIILIAHRESESRYLEHARLYASIAGRSSLADNGSNGARFRAAAAATLAAAGTGVEEAEVSENERKRLRTYARDWLRADLAFWKLARAQDANQANSWIEKTVGKWPHDPDLAALRAPEELRILSEEERRDCEELWEEVREVLTSVRGTP